MRLTGLVCFVWLTLRICDAFSLHKSHSRLSLPQNRVKSRPLTIYSKEETSTEADVSVEVSSQSGEQYVNPQRLPCGDDLDKSIVRLGLPAVLNLAILPLVGAADTFWVGRMGNALCLAGQGAANQIFNSVFWVCSFLPSIVTPLVAKAAGSGDQEEVQKRVSEAVFIAVIMGAIGTALLLLQPAKALGLVLEPGSGAWAHAKPYLMIRALTFIPAMVSTVGFAAFRGTMDVRTPLRISLQSNLLNMIADPFFIFQLGLGVAGAAGATCMAEAGAFLMYLRSMAQRGMIRLHNFQVPSLQALRPLLVGGTGVQLRSVAMNMAFIAVTRTTQALDSTGTAAAAHAITVQLWQLGGIVLLALSTVASILVPREMAQATNNVSSLTDPRVLRRSRVIANRLFSWGLFLGVGLGGLQLACLPLLLVFSPLPEVQSAARLPSIVGACLQVINGVVFIGEGIQQGNQYFGSLAAVTVVASAAMIAFLKRFGQRSLIGVWVSFAVFNFIRLLGVLHHHSVAGPLSPRAIRRSEEAWLKMGRAL